MEFRRVLFRSLILQDVSPLQLRGLRLDSKVHAFAAGQLIFARNDTGSSMFALAQGSVAVEVNPDDASITVPIGQGSIFGEVGLISGLRRGATILAAAPVVPIDVSCTAALKFLATSPGATRVVNRTATDRQPPHDLGSGLPGQDTPPT